MVITPGDRLQNRLRRAIKVEKRDVHRAGSQRSLMGGDIHQYVDRTIKSHPVPCKWNIKARLLKLS